MSVEEVKGKDPTREEKDRLVEESRSSGQTQKEWCTSHGIRLRTLRSWICDKNRRERETPESQDPVTWIEAGVSERSRKTNPQVFNSCTVEVCIGPFVVRVSSGFDRAMFADICRTLSELC